MDGILVRERGFLFLIGMPRPALGESCTTSLKDFVIFPPHQKKNNNNNKLKLLWQFIKHFKSSEIQTPKVIGIGY